MMDKITNEQLCIATQCGNKWAENALIENNLLFIRKTVYEIWSAQRKRNAAPAIHNAMPDYIRRLNPTFEAKNLDSIIRLDEAKRDEKRDSMNL